jgi:hypothetical protein
MIKAIASTAKRTVSEAQRGLKKKLRYCPIRSIRNPRTTVKRHASIIRYSHAGGTIGPNHPKGSNLIMIP